MEPCKAPLGYVLGCFLFKEINMKVIYNDGIVRECEPSEELLIIRHTAAHVMAQAIKRLFPHADFAYGPVNEKGF